MDGLFYYLLLAKLHYGLTHVKSLVDSRIISRLASAIITLGSHGHSGIEVMHVAIFTFSLL